MVHSSPLAEWTPAKAREKEPRNTKSIGQFLHMSCTYCLLLHAEKKNDEKTLD